MYEKILEALKKLGIITAENEATVTETIKPLIAEPGAEPPKAEPPDISKLDPAIQQMINALQAQIDAQAQSNKDLLAVLSKEREDREKAAKALTDKAAADKAEAAKKAVDEAIKKGLFPEAKRETMQAIADGGIENFNKLIADMKPDPLFKEENSGGNKEDKSGGVKSPLDSVNPGILGSIKKMQGQAENE